MLAHYSQYFRGCFKEGITGELKLPEQEPVSFVVLTDFPIDPKMQYQPHGDSVEAQIQKCFRFIEFADAFDVWDATSVGASFLDRTLADEYVLDKHLDTINATLTKMQPNCAAMKVIAKHCLRRIGEEGKEKQYRYND